ncbi:MAG: histidine phosphatase family protein [Bacteroidetes bacterium]|nr:histidine phosphatase family protein [Bacteroidota bacterium]
MSDIRRKVKVLYLVRHAEKESSFFDSDLSTAGHGRAKKLAHLFQHETIDHVFSTDLPRTLNTIRPTAEDQFALVEFYNYRDVVGLAHKIISDDDYYKVLIGGHSDNVPMLIRALGINFNVGEIPLDEYDNLYIVTLFDDGTSVLEQKKY